MRVYSVVPLKRSSRTGRITVVQQSTNARMQACSRSLLWQSPLRPAFLFGPERLRSVMASDRHVQASAAQEMRSSVKNNIAVAQLTSSSSAEENLSACTKLVEVS